jgi:hypothetical protein
LVQVRTVRAIAAPTRDRARITRPAYTPTSAQAGRCSGALSPAFFFASAERIAWIHATTCLRVSAEGCFAAFGGICPADTRSSTCDPVPVILHHCGHECLPTGGAFFGSSRVELVTQILHSDPVSPRSLAPGVSEALESVILRCLRKSRRSDSRQLKMSFRKSARRSSRRGWSRTTAPGQSHSPRSEFTGGAGSCRSWLAQSPSWRQRFRSLAAP